MSEIRRFPKNPVQKKRMEKSLDEIRKFMEDQVPFNRHLGVIVDELRRGFARFLIPFRNEFIGDKRRPALHGGVISALIDTCGGAAVWTHFTKEDRISTVDIRVDYLRPGPNDGIIAESEVKRVGNRVGVVHTRVYSAKDKDTIIAEGRAVYNIRRVQS
jgi:uncharacterized protein (TIGR00369 family)